MKQLVRISGLALAALALVGCGDDGGSSSAPSNADQVVASFEDLTQCTARREGATAYVKDEKTEYACLNGSWVPVDGAGSDSASVVGILNKTITVVSQKGPFVNGASVTVQELDGMTFAQTGKSFKGKISGDKGEFTVSSVSLASQYALLEANGYYLNENTGAKSNSTIALNALVDLSKRENVNINLLTHLEYERALHLISTSKGVAEAKKQAEGEIFKAFGVTGDFANSEELDILAKGEGDAALLAISVLMQGNLSEAELSERLANFANDIEQDGTWDDAATKAQMADWASTADFATIRATVEGWNAGSKAPAFEQTIKAFWWNEYGLGNCAAANDGEIKQDANSLSSRHNVRYICDAGDWRAATAREYDTYGWSAEADGNLKKGQITEAFYKYDSLQAHWVAVNARDTALGLNSCTQKREAKVGIGDDYGYYICRNGQWQDASGLEYVRSAKTCLHDANLIVGSTADENRYVCDADTFRVASESERSVNRGCTGYNLNEERQAAGYMRCSRSGVWAASTHTVPGTMTYGGQTYKTIGIGMQTWMAENLNYATVGSACHKNSADSCAKYGRIYRGDTARHVCPNGWHLPNISEWETLFRAIGDSAATKLKSTTGWAPNNAGTDAYGFSVIPVSNVWTDEAEDDCRSSYDVVACVDELVGQGAGGAGTGAMFWSFFVDGLVEYVPVWFGNSPSPDYDTAGPYPAGYYYASVRCIKD